MHDAPHASLLPPVLLFLGAAVLAVPLCVRLKLGAVVAYLLAGIALGPGGFALVADPAVAARVAEIGVVMLLFIVGLEMEPEKLRALKGDIAGLGFAQLAITGAIVAGIGLMLGLKPAGAVLAGIALALSATAVALRILEERNELGTPYGQRTFAVLLFQDLTIAPILALGPLLAGASGASLFGMESLVKAATALGAVAALVAGGYYLLNPLFRFLAAAGAREVMTAAALLVVLGAALAMETVGLSMALGAFLAGALLSTSSFKHELEADIEPFRGLLLGLFFMAVGMGIDVALVRANLGLVLAATATLIVVKVALVGLLMRTTGSSRADALRAAVLLSPAGEFAFVLLPLAAGLGLLDGGAAGLGVAVAALTMLVGPLLAGLVEVGLARARGRDPAPGLAEDFEGAGGAVLVIGFGRFGQVVNQVLLTAAVDVTVIERDVEAIQAAARFGFKVYFGDGTRLDVLRAAGAERAEVICVCVDDPEAATRIVDLARGSFPRARVHARAYDRVHAIALENLGADLHVRETLHSALAFGRATLEALGIAPEHANAVKDEVRKRDAIRLAMQREEGMASGGHLVRGMTLRPEPLLEPHVASRALTEETRRLLAAKPQHAADGREAAATRARRRAERVAEAPEPETDA